MDKNNKNTNICFVAGRSGGHIIPALTIASQIRKKKSLARITFFTSSKSLDQQIMKQHYKIIDKVITINLPNFPNKALCKYPAFTWNFVLSFFKSIYQLLKNRPQKVISMGGDISIPVCIAAFILRISIELYELNATPGRAVKLLAPLTNSLCICFKQALPFFPTKKTKLVDYPIRFSQKKMVASKELFKKYDLSPFRFTILILCGSQGSVSINNFIKKWIAINNALHLTIQIIHQTGQIDRTNWATFYKNLKIPAITFDFQIKISQYCQIADLIICRSGSGTLFETLFFKKKCITIPLETITTSHQLENALAIQKEFPELVTTIREKDIENNINFLGNCIKKSLSAYKYLP